MKKVNLIINLILVAAVGVLFVLHFTENDKTANTGPVKESENIAGSVHPGGELNFAYVRIDSLLANMDMYSDFIDKMNAKQTKLEKSIGTKLQSLEKEFIDYQTKASKGLLLRREMEEIELGLSNKQQQIEIERNNALAELQEENLVGTNKVMNFIEEFLNDFNADQRYNYIFSYSFGNNLLYVDESDDITNQVLEGLNKKYLEEQSGK